jgi:hypothetical protein
MIYSREWMQHAGGETDAGVVSRMCRGDTREHGQQRGGNGGHSLVHAPRLAQLDTTSNAL